MLLTLCIAFLFLTVLVIIDLFRKVYKHPSGPYPLPILGNMLYFLTAKDYMKTIDALHSKYGDVFTLWIGNKAQIIISNWYLTKEILKGRNSSINHRPPLAIFEQIFDGQTNLLFGNPSSEWRNLKKTVSLTMRNFVSSGKLDKVVNQVMLDIENTPNLMDSVLDGNSFANSVVFRCIFSMAFGSLSEKAAEEGVKVFQDAKNIIHELVVNELPKDCLPFQNCIFLKRERKIMTVMSRCKDFVRRMCHERQNRFEDCNDDFLDAVMMHKKETNAIENSIKDSVANCMLDLFFASSDSTTCVVSWCLLYLSKYSEIQKKVFEEIKTVIGDTPVCHHFANQCHYTQAFLFEVMRLRPPGYFILPYYTKENIIVEKENNRGALKIPIGTTILFNVTRMYKNESLWKDAEDIRPERFLNENGAFERQKNDHYIPFGVGSRSCPGEKFALNFLFCFIASILSQYRVLDKSDSSKCLQDCMEPNYKGILALTKPFDIALVKRS